MRYSKVVQVASLALFAGVLSAPLAVNADTPGCAGRVEVDSLHVGMSPASVRSLFDAQGWYDGDGSDNTYKISFRACWNDDRKVVTFFGATNGLLRRWDVRDR